MKVETDAVLVVFWRWEEMVLRWHRPVGRSMSVTMVSLHSTVLLVWSCNWCTVHYR